jgi:hypothetical protein
MAEAGTNPYLALLQQQDTGPTWAQVLQNIGNLGFGLAGGFGQAAATGQPTMAGIGPGLMMGNQMNVQAANAAEQDRLKRAEIGLKAQEYEDKRAEVKRKQDALDAYLKAPGFNITPQAGPLFGPGGTPSTGTPSTGTPQPGPDLKTAGAPLVQYLVAQHNLSPVAAAALIGNLGWESPGFNTSQSHDGGRGFGLAGWDPGRTAGLQAFAAAQGKPVTDLQTQLDYAVSEMKGGTDMGAARAYAMLQQAQTPEQANAALMHFFRPAGYTPANPTGGHGFGGRVANTRALLPQQRPVDPATAPVPGVGPDPDAVPVAPPGPLPRPGLGPRAMPPGPAQDGVPVAQGGDTGEVVLPRIGLPFPARPPVAAPPGSVPFPVIPAGPPPGATVMPGGTGVDPNAPAPSFMQPTPGGPNVVQPQYTPQPGQPTMAPGGGPAPAANPPPTFVPPAQVPVPAEVVMHFKRLAAVGLITPEQSEKAISDYGTELNKQVHEAARAQFSGQVEIWKQREQVAVEQRKIQAQVEAEQRRIQAQVEAEQRAAAQEQQRHERGQKEEVVWVRGDDGVERAVPKADLKPGMTRLDKPAEPPAGYQRKAGGELEFIPGGPADPAIARRSAPMNTEQANAASFADRMHVANQLLNTLDVQGTHAKERLSEMVPGGGYMQTPEYQQFKQAKENFINAQLRRESGAAISASEFAKAESQYFPQPGDKPEVIKQKAANRQLAYEGMVRGAGPAYQPAASASAPSASTPPQTAPAPAQPAGANTGNVPVYDLSGKRIK